MFHLPGVEVVKGIRIRRKGLIEAGRRSIRPESIDVVFKFEQPWYTPKEVGEIIKKSPVSVAKIFRGQEGVFDAAVGHGSDNHNREHLRISAEALERWIRSRQNPARRSLQ